jgi:hypothetical protein
MKKVLFFIALLWISFMAFLIFRNQINKVVDASDKGTEKVVQKESVSDISSEVSSVKSSATRSEVSEVGEINKKEPIALVTEIPEEKEPPSVKMIKERIERSEPMNEQNASIQESSRSLDNLDSPFGLIITKFERQPSRFRLVSWKGTKKVQIEDLEKYNAVEKTFPRHWIKVGIPYVEWLHPVSKLSTFKPYETGNSKPRIQAISFEIRRQVLSFSGTARDVGFLILKDTKLGGVPYEITNEMKAPLSSSYAIHCQQHIGANKYFHNLSGKRRGYKFGGWGYEYRINHFNFPDRKITVTRKDLKTRKLTQVILSAPAFSI